MRSFKGNIIISTIYSQPCISIHISDVKIYSHSILLTHFLSVYFRTPAIVKQTSYQSSCVFRAALIILKYTTAITWGSYFFAGNFFSEYLAFWSNYLFLITTSWWQMLSLKGYFLKINTISSQLLCRRSVFSRKVIIQIIYFFEQVLLLSNSYFFRRGSFLGADISWKQSLFLIVLRDQFSSIYTWKGFPLTSIHSF